jgi:nitronate monooxygenase
LFHYTDQKIYLPAHHILFKLQLCEYNASKKSLAIVARFLFGFGSKEVVVLELPRIAIRGGDDRPVFTTIDQAGMGFAVSGPLLAAASARCGLLGVLSGVGLKVVARQLLGRELGDFEAAKLAAEETIRLAGGKGKYKGRIAVNCMALMGSCEETIRGAQAGGIDTFIVGAGILRSLFKLVAGKEATCIPIVSSLRLLESLCRIWKRPPDAVIFEGPLAGGHLGFTAEQISNPAFQLEAIVPSIIEFASRNGNFPVIVAGGVWDRADILRLVAMGAAGVQMGTRFLATTESGASSHFKWAATHTTRDNIIIAVEKGSPAPMPFRVLASSPGLLQALAGAPVTCRLGEMLHNGTCKALTGTDAFCICEGLYAAIQENPDPKHGAIYTVGAKAYRFMEEGKGVVSVKELVEELTGYPISGTA